MSGSPCSSLFSPFFSLFRGDSGFDKLLKNICFQMVDQKARLCAEQELNREIIRLIREIILPDKGHNREITGQDRFKQDWAPSRPGSAGRNVAADRSAGLRFDPAPQGSKHWRQSTSQSRQTLGEGSKGLARRRFRATHQRALLRGSSFACKVRREAASRRVHMLCVIAPKTTFVRPISG